MVAPMDCDGSEGSDGSDGSGGSDDGFGGLIVLFFCIGFYVFKKIFFYQKTKSYFKIIKCVFDLKSGNLRWGIYNFSNVSVTMYICTCKIKFSLKIVDMGLKRNEIEC